MDRTRRAEIAIRQSEVIAGYTKYIELVDDICCGKELISTGMTQEVDRCRMALKKAAEGKTVALISSGDAGIYGMAGLAIELAEAEGLDVPIEVVPGVSAANAAGGLLGAPLALDFATISLSDLLVPWQMIRQRLEAVAAADLACALYNPKSKKRVTQLEEAAEIFRKHRPGATPVGVCDSIGLAEQSVIISDLDNFMKEKIAMRTIIVIGSSGTRVIRGRMVTPRGYQI
ncbi:MAG: precorrin-3B C(17)-methyltransferase [Nitrospinota bacterium]|nr:precorrin-3B C(17)-methyltransferase [Nitrospinota bacterium]